MDKKEAIRQLTNVAITLSTIIGRISAKEEESLVESAMKAKELLENAIEEASEEVD